MRSPIPLTIVLSPFQPEDQLEARALVLTGLGEHWGWIDESLNPDLNDIAHSYADGLFLVARLDGRLVGTGAFKPHSSDTVEIVRMSVATELRRLGIGHLILDALCREARKRGFTRVVLETTETWQEVIAFYLRSGFEITHHQDGDVYFAKALASDR
jgi:GNAT superfamily N-acetyltransferase